jgi:hypothetical protein
MLRKPPDTPALIEEHTDAHHASPADGQRRMVGVNKARERLDESRGYFTRHSLPKLRYYKAGRAIRIDESSIDELIEQRLSDTAI